MHSGGTVNTAGQAQALHLLQRQRERVIGLVASKGAVVLVHLTQLQAGLTRKHHTECTAGLEFIDAIGCTSIWISLTGMARRALPTTGTSTYVDVPLHQDVGDLLDFTFLTRLQRGAEKGSNHSAMLTNEVERQMDTAGTLQVHNTIKATPAGRTPENDWRGSACR